jgi:hypothetical protein
MFRFNKPVFVDVVAFTAETRHPSLVAPNGSNAGGMISPAACASRHH